MYETLQLDDVLTDCNVPTREAGRIVTAPEIDQRVSSVPHAVAIERALSLLDDNHAQAIVLISQGTADGTRGAAAEACRLLGIPKSSLSRIQREYESMVAGIREGSFNYATDVKRGCENSLVFLSRIGVSIHDESTMVDNDTDAETIIDSLVTVADYDKEAAKEVFRLGGRAGGSRREVARRLSVSRRQVDEAVRSTVDAAIAHVYRRSNDQVSEGFSRRTAGSPESILGNLRKRLIHDEVVMTSELDKRGSAYARSLARMVLVMEGGTVEAVETAGIDYPEAVKVATKLLLRGENIDDGELVDRLELDAAIVGAFIRDAIAISNLGFKRAVHIAAYSAAAAIEAIQYAYRANPDITPAILKKLIGATPKDPEASIQEYLARVRVASIVFGDKHIPASVIQTACSESAAEYLTILDNFAAHRAAGLTYEESMKQSRRFRTEFQPVASRPGVKNWQKLSKCLDYDPAVFQPAYGDEPAVRAAKAVCARCIVRADCLDFAIQNNEEEGVWGGQTPSERSESSPVSPERLSANFEGNLYVMLRYPIVRERLPLLVMREAGKMFYEITRPDEDGVVSLASIGNTLVDYQQSLGQRERAKYQAAISDVGNQLVAGTFDYEHWASRGYVHSMRSPLAFLARLGIDIPVSAPMSELCERALSVLGQVEHATGAQRQRVPISAMVQELYGLNGDMPADYADVAGRNGITSERLQEIVIRRVRAYRSLPDNQ